MKHLKCIDIRTMKINRKNIDKELDKLIANWHEFPTDYKEKYKSYKSKYLKKKKDVKSSGIGYWKKIEMLEVAGYIEIKIKDKS